MKEFKNTTTLHILLIIIIAISVRIFAAYFIGHKFTPKLWEYEVLTQNMLAGKGYVFNYREYGEYKALLAPGYSFLTYTVYYVFGTSHVMMLFIQFALMGIFCIIIYGLTQLFFKNNLISLIAGLLAALHPGLVYYSSTMLHQLTLYLPLFFGAVYFLCLCYKTGKLKFFILLGFVGGYAVLTRATILPIILLSLVIIVLFQRKITLKKRILFSSVSLLIILTVNLPWIIRNYITFDKLIFSQNNKNEAFWVGNNPEASGGHQRTDGTLVLNHKPPEMQKEIYAAKGNELKIEAIFKKYAFKYIKNRPGDYIKGLCKKAFYFWWFFPHTGVTYPKSYLFGYKIIYSFLVMFTIAGLLICHIRKLWQPEMSFLLILVLGVWGAHTLNFMEMRHRWTVEPVMLIFASLAIYFFAEKIYNKYRKSTTNQH